MLVIESQKPNETKKTASVSITQSNMQQKRSNSPETQMAKSIIHEEDPKTLMTSPAGSIVSPADSTNLYHKYRVTPQQSSSMGLGLTFGTSRFPLKKHSQPVVVQSQNLDQAKR